MGQAIHHSTRDALLVSTVGSVASTLYLIGPSRVGKTTAARQLHANASVIHVDLDELAMVGAAEGQPRVQRVQDWGAIGPILGDLDAQTLPGPTTLVVVGAGTQDLDRAFGDRNVEEWLCARRERVILIEGDPDVLYERNPAHAGDRPNFDLLEYGPHRRRLYQTAGHTVSFAGLTVDEAADRLGSLVQRLVAGIDP